MTINNNSVEQINVALLDMDKKLKSAASKSASASDFKNLEASVDNIKKTLNETKTGLEPGKTYNINISGNAATAYKAKEAEKANKLVNALTVNGETYDGSEAVDTGVQKIENGGTGVTTQADINKAFIGDLEVGNSDVTDGTEFVSSYASDNGFADSNALNKPYKRQFIKVWNYIKGKISSVLGLTSEKVSSYDSHLSNKDNPHSVTKSQVGLGSVVNTGDSAIPVSGGTTKFTTGGAYTELNKKVDKVDGKGLSSNDFTNTYKDKLDNTDTTVTANSSNLVTSGAVATAISTEVTNRNTAITNAINNLDVSSVGGDGKYISAISETNGKISATSTTMDTAPTTNSVKAVTSGGIKTAISTAETNAKNLANATGTLAIANGGTGATTQADINKAFVGALEEGISDVTDGTMFVSSWASDNGFAYTDAVNTPYKRKFLSVWNYIKDKISSVLGLTKDNYGGKAATAGTADKATNDSNGNNIANTYAKKTDLSSWNIYDTNYSGNPDDCLIGKWYSINTGSNSTNMPNVNNGWATLITFAANNNPSYKQQLCFYSNDNTIYIRTCFNDAWGSWVSLSKTGHTHEYLPLSGGTMTGNIRYRGSKAAYDAIKFIDNLDDIDGNGISIGAGGLTIIGGGESSDTVAAQQASGGEEKMIVANDNAIDFYTNCQNGFASAKHITMNNDGTITADGFNGTATKARFLVEVGGSGVSGAKLVVHGATVSSNSYTDTNPKLEFKNNDGSQNVSLTFTDFDAVQAPASLTLNGNQGNEYFIAPNIKATTKFIGNLIGNVTGNVSGSSGSAGKLTTARTAYVDLGTASTTRAIDWSGDTTIPVNGVLQVEHGGTGASTAEAAANSLIASLSASNGVPVDSDYFISQVVNGGPFVPGYERRPISKLWEYIKGKILQEGEDFGYNHIVYDDASLLEWANCTDGSMKKVLVKSGTYNMTKGVDFSKAGTGYVFAENGAVINSKVPIAFSAPSGKTAVHNLKVVCGPSSDNTCAFSASDILNLILYDCEAGYATNTITVDRNLFSKCTCYNCHYNFTYSSSNSSMSIKVFYQCYCYNCICKQTIAANSSSAVSFATNSFFYKECVCISCDAELTILRNIKAATPSFSCYYNCWDRCVGCLSTINVNSKALTVYSTLYGFLRCQHMSSCKEVHTVGYTNIKGVVQCIYISSTSAVSGESNTNVGNSCSIQ